MATFSLSRRAALCGAAVWPAAAAAEGSDAVLQRDLAALERAHGGRLGVAVIDVGDGRIAGLRTDERFPLCSTFKALAAACVLARVDRGEERLDRQVVYGAGDLVPYSPVTGEHTGPPGLAMGVFC